MNAGLLRGGGSVQVAVTALDWDQQVSGTKEKGGEREERR
jgi:hypothetical protein